MIVVELRRRVADTAAVEAIARVFVPVPGGPAVIEPVDPSELPVLDVILGDGVPDERGATLWPQDGEAYVLALPGALRGSRLWAERVP